MASGARSPQASRHQSLGTLSTPSVTGSGSTVRVRNFHRPGARFDQYIEHIYELLRARGIKRKTDPRVPIYLAMVMLEYPETLEPGRRREQVGLKALAGMGRLFEMRTVV